MNYRSWLENLLSSIEKQGWTYRKGAGHYIAYPPDKTKPCITISASPSDTHAYKNVLKHLKKMGYKEV